jgi:hypothetical protein
VAPDGELVYPSSIGTFGQLGQVRAETLMPLQEREHRDRLMVWMTNRADGAPPAAAPIQPLMSANLNASKRNIPSGCSDTGPVEVHRRHRVAETVISEVRRG